MPPARPGPERLMQPTRLNRPWFYKVAIFFIIFVGFGVWGWWEATVTYPRRGQRYADTRLYEYLKAEKAAGGSLTSRVSVPDPVGEMARLKGSGRSLSETEQRRLEWLESLQVVGRLRPDYTTVGQPDTRIPSALGPSEDYVPDPSKNLPTAEAALDDRWAKGNMPKKLEWYDIPAQWAFVIIGLGGGLWLGGLFAAVARKRYSWDEATRTLTLPGGATLSPADLEDVDKRKWDKYIVFLKIKPSHPTLGGRELKLDLYRYSPLEAWVLEMERAAFPERAEKEGAEETAPGGGVSTPE